ncbi:hypothetical protein Y032_0315g2261 [Ancylostoma ceylanicum]|uniref:Uncharacterized protein n=1 Tax=Ancylostoma ceylanicum TaxID=53326 RepID=A0A016S1F6_9BILA|nr:hypothetical protein Y032_0315g2261 [Ancylostoma ceylanicum]
MQPFVKKVNRERALKRLLEASKSDKIADFNCGIPETINRIDPLLLPQTGRFKLCPEGLLNLTIFEWIQVRRDRGLRTCRFLTAHHSNTSSLSHVPLIQN